jgi:hypothetical protein
MRCVSATIAAIAFLTPSAMIADGLLSITNYKLVSTQAINSTLSSVTYSADLLNSGPALASVTATVSTTEPFSVRVVPGQDTLNFAPVPADSQVPGSGTFTLLVSPSGFDFSALQWTFQSTVAQVIANAGPNQTVTAGSLVTLNGSASTNPSGVGTLSYRWMFTSRPTGSAAVLSNYALVMPTFVADVAGNYVIMLTVSNGTATSSASVTVTTGNSPPVAKAGPNQTVPLGSTVVLNGSGSSDVNGDPLTYSWTFIGKPTGSAATLMGANTVSPTFVADFPAVSVAPPGTEGNMPYIVQLIVNDGVTNSAPSTVTITTIYTSPVANAGPNQTVMPGSLVQLNGSGSTDVDGIPLTYHWSIVSLPSGSSATLNNPNIVNPNFTGDLLGIYVVQLIVNDGISNSAPATVTISTGPIQAPMANAGPNQGVQQHAVVQLQGSGSDPQGLPLTFQWALVSKPVGSVAVLSSTTAMSPTFTADLPGTYVAQLIVSSGFLNSPPATVTISTNSNTPPVANPGPNQIVALGATVLLDGSGSSDADNDPLTYSWKFLSVPSGSAATLTGATTAKPTFVADVAGTYVVQLIVNDGSVPSSPATVTIAMQSLIMPVNPTGKVGSTAPFQVSLAQPAPSPGVFVTFSISDSTKVTLNTTTYFIPEGQTTNPTRAPPQITGVAAGSATITGSVFGLPSASVQVQVTP